MSSVLNTKTAEKSIIGIVLKNCDLFDNVLASVDADSFTTPTLKKVFEICEKHSISDKDWTWETIADSLEDERAYSIVSEIVSQAPDKIQLPFFLSQLGDKKLRIKAELASEEFKELLSDPSASSEDLYISASRIADSFESIETGKILVAGPENFWELIKPDIQTMIKSDFIGTCYQRIDDHLTFGFVPGVSVISGRPTMGKSSFRANIQRLLSQRGFASLTISREQSLLDEYFRHLAIQTSMPVATIVRGLRGIEKDELYPGFKPEVFERAIEYLQNPARPHQIIEPRGLFFLKDVKKYVELYRKTGADPKIVFIDLFNQLDDFSAVHEPGKKAGMIANKLAQVGYMARDIQIHICCIVQLKRMGKDRGKIDRQEMYAESGAYEQRADLMFQIERPAYYKPDEILDDTMQIYIGKQRMGERAVKINLLWEKEYMRISDEAPSSSGEEESVLGSSFVG